MVNQNLGQLVDGLRFVDIKVENISQGITQSVCGVRSHVSHKINQLCRKFSAWTSFMTPTENEPRKE